MKQIFTILSASLLLVACRNTPQQTLGSQATSITAEQAAEFAEFEAWKEQKAIAEAKQLLAEKEAAAKPTVIYVSQPAAPVRTVAKKPTQYAYTTPASQQATQPVQQKKKWSSAAKGAVIGAGAGAVAGAIISKKNRALGALIGAAAGGAGGFGIGKMIDKKNGR